MSWVKLDDKFHDNAKQLQASDRAFRVWVCSMSYCADISQPTGFISTAQARGLIVKLGKTPHVIIAELLTLGAWEEVEGGYLLHDFEYGVSKSSAERVRKWREEKRAGNGHVTPDVTPPETRYKNVTVPARATGNPIPKPIPVTSSTTSHETATSKLASTPRGRADGLKTPNGRTDELSDLLRQWYEISNRQPNEPDANAAATTLAAHHRFSVDQRIALLHPKVLGFLEQGKVIPGLPYFLPYLEDQHRELAEERIDEGERQRRRDRMERLGDLLPPDDAPDGGKQ